MRRARPLVAAAFLAAALLPTHRAPAQEATGPQIEEVPSSIAELLDDHARAYRERSAELLAATIDPDIVEAERESFNNAADVRFASLEIRPNTRFSGNLATRRIRVAYPGLDVATYHVVESSRIASETQPYVEDGAYTFVRDPQRRGYDGWRLASKTDLDVLGFFSPRHLWDEGEVTVMESERFVLLTHPDVADEVRPVLQVAERAYDRVREFWPRSLEDRYVIVVPSTTAELGRIMNATIDLENFVAFVAAGADREDGWEPTGPRLFIHLAHLRRYSEGSQTEIIAHELVHAVTRKLGGPHVPIWVEEGLANLGGGTGGRASRARQGPLPETFPSRERFVTGPVTQIQAVYDQSQVAIEALVDHAGREGLADFYERLGSARVVPGTEAYHVRAALEDSVGWTYEQWLSAWRARLR